MLPQEVLLDGQASAIKCEVNSGTADEGGDRTMLALFGGDIVVWREIGEVLAFYRVRWWTLPVCYSVNVRHGQCHSSTKAVALLMQLLRCAILLNESCVLHLTLTLSVLCRGPTREELKGEGAPIPDPIRHHELETSRTPGIRNNSLAAKSMRCG